MCRQMHLTQASIAPQLLGMWVLPISRLSLSLQCMINIFTHGDQLDSLLLFSQFLTFTESPYDRLIALLKEDGCVIESHEAGHFDKLTTESKEKIFRVLFSIKQVSFLADFEVVANLSSEGIRCGAIMC